ncbi:MAG: oligosaccharide flippase family protein [Phycisphaerales bacterium]
MHLSKLDAPPAMTAREGPANTDGPSAAPAGGAARPGLGAVAARGTLWSVAEVITSKALSLGAQWGLSWLITEGEMGLANLAANAAALFFLANPVAVSDLLVARSARFRHWVRAGTLLSFAAGVLSFLVLLVLGPLLGWTYGEAKAGTPLAFTVLLGVAAVRYLGDTCAAVPQTQLRLAYRFRTISAVQVCVNVVLAAASLGLAWAGAGAYAIVGGASAAALFRAVTLWSLSGLRAEDMRRSPPARLLLGGLGSLTASQYLNTLAFTGGTLILGLFRDESQVGLYAFAFNLSYQVNVLLSYNLSVVLQPVFASLQGQTQRQADAFVRATGVITSVAVPLCLLQGALAEPLLRAAFKPNWMASLQELVILSGAQALAIAAGPCLALIKAQRRFGVFLRLQAWQTAAYVVALFILCPLAGGDGAAWAVVAQFAIFAPVSIVVALRPAGAGSVRNVISLMAAPLLPGLPAAALAWWISSLFPHSRGGAAAALVAGGAAGGAACLGLMALLQRHRLRTIVGALRRR